MNRTAGFTTLTISLMLVSILVAVSAFIGKVLVSDKRIALNEIEYRVAFAAVEKGIAEAIAELKINPATTSVSGSVASAAASAIYDVTISAAAGTAGVKDIVATATLANGAQTSASVQVAERSVLNPNNSGPSAPMVVAGNVPLNGSITLVVNPDGGGKGVPVSLWSSAPVNITGSALTCGLDEYTYGGCTTSNAMSYKQGADEVIGPDIVHNDPGFPADVVDYVFGEPDTAEGWARIEARATAIVSSCTDPRLSGGAGMFIVKDAGSCSLGSLGSKTAPVLIITKDNSLTISGNSNFYGVVFAYDSNPADSTHYTIKVNGNAKIYGALLTNHPNVDLPTGNFDAIYDQEVLCNISACSSSSLGNGSSNPFVSVSMVPGSWKDW